MKYNINNQSAGQQNKASNIQKAAKTKNGTITLLSFCFNVMWSAPIGTLAIFLPRRVFTSSPAVPGGPDRAPGATAGPRLATEINTKCRLSVVCCFNNLLAGAIRLAGKTDEINWPHLARAKGKLLSGNSRGGNRSIILCEQRFLHPFVKLHCIASGCEHFLHSLEVIRIELICESLS